MPLSTGLSFMGGAMAPAELEWQRVLQGRREMQAQQDAQRAWQEQLRSLTSPDASVLPQQFTPMASQGQMAQPQTQPPAPPMSGSSGPPSTPGAPGPPLTLPQQSATVSPTGAGPIQPGAGAGPTSPGVPAASRPTPGGSATPPAGGQAQMQEPFDPLQRVKQWAKEIDKSAPNAPSQVKAVMLQQRIAMAKSAFPEEKALMMTQVQMERLQAQQNMLTQRLDAQRDNAIRNQQTRITIEGMRDTSAMDRTQARIGAAKQAASGGGTLDDDTARTLAEAWVQGDRTVTSGLGFGKNGAANRAKVMEQATKLIKERGGSGEDLAVARAEFMGQQAGERTAATQAARIGFGIAELQQFIPLVESAQAKIDRTKYPTVNSLMLALQKGTGDENAVVLGQAVMAVKNAYSQIATRGGQTTDDARRRSDEVIDKAWSSGQLSAGLDQLMKEAEAAEKAVGTVRSGIGRQIQGRKGQIQAPAQGGESDPLGIR